MSEKTEEPTDRKLEEAREKGQSPKSSDITAAVGLIGMLLVLMGTGGSIYEQLSNSLTLVLHQGMRVQTNEELLALLAEPCKNALSATVPVLCASVLLAVMALFAQIGFNLSFDAVAPKFDKLNPAEGLKKIISVRSLIELGKTLVKAIVLGWVIWTLVKGTLPLLVGSAYLSPISVGIAAWSTMLHLVGAACLVFVVIGPVDFGMQRWMFMKDQKMTKDDIKRENKDSNGDPHLKGEMRRLQHEMATTDPKQRVPGATVVVTNPTHFAVALFYDTGGAALPRIVAKGMDAQAAVIRELAKEHRIPVVGNPPLARSLYRVAIDQPIPEELFEAVAAVLLWVAEVESLAAAPLVPRRTPSARTFHTQ